MRRIALIVLFIFGALSTSSAQTPEWREARKAVLIERVTTLMSLERDIQMGRGDWRQAVQTIQNISAELYPADKVVLKVDLSKMTPDPAGHSESTAMWRQQIWPQSSAFYVKAKTELRALQ